MKKSNLVILSVLALSLVGANTAMAKSEKSDNHKFVSVSAKKKTGLENALEHVKNPKARAAIKRAMERKKLKEEENQPIVKSDEQIVAADKAALKIGFSGSDTISNVTEAIKLATTGNYGSTITWTSSNTAVISNDGKTIIPSDAGDVKVVLTATITKNKITTTKTFELIVKIKLTDSQIVIADKAALTIGFGTGDNAGLVTAPLTLPAKGTNGSVITWISSNSAIISNDGKTVIRPTIGQGDAVVTLIANIASNGVADTKLFTLVVKQQLTDTDKVAADKTSLAISFTEGDSAVSVTSKLALPALGVNGSTVTWISSNPAVISNDGKTVARPAAGQGDVAITLIATITSNGVTDVKTFNLVVKQQLTDVQKAAADKAALQIGFGGTDTAASVTSKLSLPAVGMNGSIIVWYSSNTAIISDSGTVIRPAAGTGDRTVTLSAIIISNASVETKAFAVTVKQLSN